MADVARCRRCILPVDRALTKGHLSADASGLCDLCRTHEKRFGWPSSPPPPRRTLDRLVEWARSRRGEWDALIPISGGKDSLSVLDFMAREYPGLRILTVTLDNGFLNPAALEACRVVTRVLGIPHLMWSPPRMAETAAIFLRKTGHFCAPCQVAMMNMMYGLTRWHRIPMVILGSSRRFDGAHPETANPWSPPFFNAVLRNVPEATGVRQEICCDGLLFRFGMSILLGRLKVVLLPDLLDWDKEANRERLAARYSIEIGKEHADCLAHPVADWLYKRRLGFGQKTASLAAAVRNGLMSREDALRTLAGTDEFGDRFPTEEARGFLERVKVTAEDVVACSSCSPEPYFNSVFKAVGFARRLLGFSIV